MIFGISDSSFRKENRQDIKYLLCFCFIYVSHSFSYPVTFLINSELISENESSYYRLPQREENAAFAFCVPCCTF